MSITYLDPFPPGHAASIPPCLKLSTIASNEAILFRLLLGTLDIEYEYQGKKTVIKQRKKLNDALGITNTRLTNNIFEHYLHPLTFTDLENYFTKTRGVNVKFITDLNIEYSYFFINEKKGNHTIAFLHCYRLLEFISYSFPLIFSSLSKSYEGTYNDLNSYFTKDGGEITFLKNFVKKLFDSDPILNSTFDIEITGPTSEIQEKIYKVYKVALAKFSPTTDDGLCKLSFEYSQLIEIIKMLRNRFFHFAIGGQRNIKTSDIIYPDLFFEQINSIAINWISIIYFEILKSSIDRWK